MTYQHVEYLWEDAAAAALDPVGRLVYRSNLLGSDHRITNTGGGNTSAKLTEQDPLTGEAQKGPKTPAEDKMAGMYAHATFSLNPRAPSIDTPLHSFLPFKHVDHIHPNAAISVAAAKQSEKLTRGVEALQSKLRDGLARYREDYASYHARCKRANSPPMRDPNPTVILIPGLGMVAWGKDKSESRVTAEFSVDGGLHEAFLR
jgi:rhamnose utilization protein RhaD (predicted bifunctional aldolase and dehydrogenase)